MAKGFAIHNAPTNHGGIIPSTQVRSSQQGNLFVRAGDGHFCPRCKCWSMVIKSHDHVVFDGKPVAYAGDKLTCGATIQPQQSHVVGDSGGGSLRTMPSSSQSTNSQQNDKFMDDAIKKNGIVLKDLNVAPFIPLGAPKPDGSASNDSLIFHGSIINGIFEAIVLEIKKDNKFIEIQRMDKLFSGSQDFKIKWDGFIQDIYDSKLMTNPSGVVFRIKGINGGSAIASDEKIFNFKYFNKNWIDIVISKKTKTIRINLRVNFIDGKAIGLHDWSMVPKVKIQQYGVQAYSSQTRPFNQLLALAIEGINYYWSRNNTHPEGKNIIINGTIYQVYVTAIASQEKAMPEMKLSYVTNVDPNNPIVRSSNWALSRKTAYITGYLRIENTWTFYNSTRSDRDFKETIAHETGHALIEAYAGFNESVTHHGSSEITQEPKTGTKYPRSGEIDLMKYADENFSAVPNGSTRMIANEKDVKGLLIISGISRK